MFVPRAKNDIYREGNYLYIKRLTSVYCPVALLERYISMCNIELSSSVALFRPVSPPILTSYMELNYHIPDVGKSLKIALRK